MCVQTRHATERILCFASFHQSDFNCCAQRKAFRWLNVIHACSVKSINAKRRVLLKTHLIFNNYSNSIRIILEMAEMIRI